MGLNGNTDRMTTLFVCGDIANELRSDGLICSAEMASLIASADYAVCNFEAPLEGFGKPVIKPGVHKSQKPVTIDGLRECGFDLLLLANNHILDYGAQALIATMERAKATSFDVVGAGPDSNTAYLPLIKTINGLRIGIVNACEAQYGELDCEDISDKAGYAWISHPIIDKTILSLRKECDFVIVFAHAGLEFYPIPQKQWRARYKHFCDLGADVVIGSHPHVPQGYEKFGRSIIFYSLGNFYLDHKGSASEDNSFSVWLELSGNGSISYRLIHHYRVNGQVNIAPQGKEIDVKRLNSILEVNYAAAHEKMVTEVYGKIKRRLAISSFLPVPLNGRLKDFFRLLVSGIVRRGRTSYKNLNLLHLLKNETYYYVIKDALAIITREKDDHQVKE